MEGGREGREGMGGQRTGGGGGGGERERERGGGWKRYETRTETNWCSHSKEGSSIVTMEQTAEKGRAL